MPHFQGCVDRNAWEKWASWLCICLSNTVTHWMICFAITKPVSAPTHCRTPQEWTPLTGAGRGQKVGPRRSVFHCLFILSGFHLKKRVMEGFLCVPRAMPSKRIRLPAEIQERTWTSIFRLSSGRPGKFQVLCVHLSRAPLTLSSPEVTGMSYCQGPAGCWECSPCCLLSWVVATWHKAGRTNGSGWGWILETFCRAGVFNSAAPTQFVVLNVR